MVGTTNRWWATMLPQNFEYPPKLKGEDRGRSSITNHLDDEMDSKFGGIDCRFFLHYLPFTTSKIKNLDNGCHVNIGCDYSDSRYRHNPDPLSRYYLILN